MPRKTALGRIIVSYAAAGDDSCEATLEAELHRGPRAMGINEMAYFTLLELVIFLGANRCDCPRCVGAQRMVNRMKPIIEEETALIEAVDAGKMH